MKDLARGYIASGLISEHRTPQHLQNQIVKAYCDLNNLTFILSRAEYWIDGNTDCQLWAALREGINNIVFYSIWQLPSCRKKRQKIYEHCLANNIILHFAVERMHTYKKRSLFSDIELLIESNLLINK